MINLISHNFVVNIQSLTTTKKKLKGVKQVHYVKKT